MRRRTAVHREPSERERLLLRRADRFDRRALEIETNPDLLRGLFRPAEGTFEAFVADTLRSMRAEADRCRLAASGTPEVAWLRYYLEEPSDAI